MRARRVRALVFFCLAAAMTACLGPERRIEPEALFWPLPPDPPRIKYLQSIYSEDDIGRTYTFLEKLFGKSYFDRMSRPYGVAVRAGKLYVSDLNLRRVLVFDIAAKRLSLLGEEGAVRTPAAAAVSTAGLVYVVDTGGSKIAVYDAAGNYTTAYPVKESKPVAVALNEALGRMYVVDRAKHRVIVLDMAGRELFTFGGRGDRDGQMNMPLDAAVDGDGTVYVLDSGNFRVQIFGPGGEFLSKFGMVGDQPGYFANPKGIALDSEGHIYVTDAAFGNFQIFDRQGRVLLYVGHTGSLPGQFQLPGGIAIDDQDRIYVADQINSRIQIFQYMKEKAAN